MRTRGLTPFARSRRLSLLELLQRVPDDLALLDVFQRERGQNRAQRGVAFRRIRFADGQPHKLARLTLRSDLVALELPFDVAGLALHAEVLRQLFHPFVDVGGALQYLEVLV